MKTPHTKERSMQERWGSSLLDGGNAAYIEQLYDEYLNDPTSVDDKWRSYFEQLSSQRQGSIDISHQTVRNQFRHFARHSAASGQLDEDEIEQSRKQVRVLQLINAYRFRGHQWADLDPLAHKDIPDIPELRYDHHDLTEADLDTAFNTGSLVGPETATLREILDLLTDTYCESIGAEYMHIANTAEKRWLQDYIEGQHGKVPFSTDKKRRILRQLIAAEGMEQFLHRKYVGQKRFSLEGGDSFIPLMHELIQRGGDLGVKEMAIGMAHRGRLNMLVNVLGKTPAELFAEFEGKQQENITGTGDVKYHMGFASDIATSSGPLHIVLAFNPSHLEIVGPVVEGSVRARQDRREDKNGREVIPIWVHGDAAFSGQGVVMETMNMSQSRGYSTKGTIHVVINNQIGFTTSNQEDSRSTLYCTDVGKMVNAPIFHVNADDPEAVLFVAQLAMDYRMRFLKDVIIDLVCYRRHGHSEADEPMATQPMMYKTIRKRATASTLYAGKLLNDGVIDASWVSKESERYRDALSKGARVVEDFVPPSEADYPYHYDWVHINEDQLDGPPQTSVPLEKLQQLHDRLTALPEGWTLHANVQKILNNRMKMMSGEMRVDWGLAETLAYASLLDEGYGVRISGQDAGRGTFFHRHSVLYNQETGDNYIPLRNLSDEQANFLVINSLLSEEAVLAFEYGYATTEPKTLTVWEAQFGDFANTAQVVVDQFISAGEQKWNRLAGLVMLLPHGLEGQGPEHSSARLERYLQLCAQNNMVVCMPTTAAQIFHLLRRQMLSPLRKPLIVMTPKSLLRHPAAGSVLEKLTDGKFQEVIADNTHPVPDEVGTVILCSGKVYNDLNEKRIRDDRGDVAIVRLEQLYPFPEEEARAQMDRYSNARRYVWCQEEPMNQGAWFSSVHHMRRVISNQQIEYAGRPMLAAPAVGYSWLHVQQLEALIDEALGNPQI